MSKPHSVLFVIVVTCLVAMIIGAHYTREPLPPQPATITFTHEQLVYMLDTTYRRGYMDGASNELITGYSLRQFQIREHWDYEWFHNGMDSIISWTGVALFCFDLIVCFSIVGLQEFWLTMIGGEE